MNDVLGVEPQNASGLEGKEDRILYFNLPELFFIDVQMRSPPESPSRNLQGASLSLVASSVVGPRVMYSTLPILLVSKIKKALSWAKF